MTLDSRLSTKSPCDESLDVVGMVGDDFFAQDAAAIRGDEDVVLKTDTTKVAVGFQQVVVDELLVETFALPFVDERGDEIDAGFVGEHPAGLDASSAAQTVGAELRGGAYLIVEAYIDLPESLHVVNVHTHHVSESVLEEHGVCSGSDGVVGIAAHQAKVLEAVGHQSADVEVHVHPLQIRMSLLDDKVVASLDDGVDVALTRGETSADGGDTCVVRAVVVDGFSTGIAEHESSCLEGSERGIAVEDFTMHAENGVERHLGAITAGDAFEETTDVLLGDTRSAGLHGGGVHLVADGHGAFDLGNLLVALHGALVDDSVDEGE